MLEKHPLFNDIKATTLTFFARHLKKGSRPLPRK
jgi:hypothetical protein